MRDHYADDDDSYMDMEPQERGGLGGLQALALLGAIALIAAPVIKSLSQRRRVRQQAEASEPAIDKTLKDTYPASDPPASRYFDIPENRK
jgi:hypothetical protein